MKQKSTTFYCFSPLVMFTTFAIEIALFFYVLWRYKASQVQRLALVTLGALATFQFAEYQVCTTGANLAVSWSQTGFIAITLLPALGIHLAYALAGKRSNKVVAFVYATMAFWVAMFTFGGFVFDGHVCTGNYVIFQLQQGLGTYYALYYYGWLVAGMVIAARLIRASRSKKVKQALKWQVIGYSSFIIPTMTANLIAPSTMAGVPSIMCGFAVIFAVILATEIMEGQKQNRPGFLQELFSKG